LVSVRHASREAGKDGVAARPTTIAPMMKLEIRGVAVIGAS
jgi:hypothetical protein